MESAWNCSFEMQEFGKEVKSPVCYNPVGDGCDGSRVVRIRASNQKKCMLVVFGNRRGAQKEKCMVMELRKDEYLQRISGTLRSSISPDDSGLEKHLFKQVNRFLQSISYLAQGKCPSLKKKPQGTEYTRGFCAEARLIH